MLIGLAAGAETDLVAYLTARYSGSPQLRGRLYGLQYSVFGFASGLSPFLFGKVFDVTGSYQPILYVAAVLFVVGAVSLLTLGRYPRFDGLSPLPLPLSSRVCPRRGTLGQGDPRRDAV